jgi:hypothetical protein
MNPYMNEEVMWQRVKDLQREAENRRLIGPRGSLIGLLISLVLGMGRSLAASSDRLVRAEPSPVDRSWTDEDSDPAADVA